VVAAFVLKSQLEQFQVSGGKAQKTPQSPDEFLLR
jgi:hypothetical protein